MQWFFRIFQKFVRVENKPTKLEISENIAEGTFAIIVWRVSNILQICWNNCDHKLFILNKKPSNAYEVVTMSYGFGTTSPTFTRRCQNFHAVAFAYDVVTKNYDVQKIVNKQKNWKTHRFPEPVLFCCFSNLKTKKRDTQTPLNNTLLM